MNNADVVYRSLQKFSSERGWIETRVVDLMLDTHLSRETIKRSLTELVKARLIERRSKSGPHGGLIIRLTTGSDSAQNSAQKSAPRHAFQDSGSGPTAQEPEPESSPGTFGSDSAQPEEIAQWFVCCIWYDEKGQMWCHGEDGLETYIPCASKDAAMELAEQHSHMFHKDKRQRYGVLPRVDVCETIGKGKALHYSYNALGGGRG